MKMSAKTQNPIISGGSSIPIAKKIEENNLMPLVIENLRSVLSDKNIIKQINELNDWSKIYDFISYHISVLTEKNEFNQVESLKQLIMLDANLALSYLVEQSKIDDVTIIETFEQVFQSFNNIIYPRFMDCLLQFIETISHGDDDVLMKLSSLVIQLLNNGYQIKSMMGPTVFQRIFNNMDSNEKDQFIFYLINKNLIPYHSIDTILNIESIIIGISFDTNPSIIFIDGESQQLIGTMVITDMTEFSEKIIVAIKENESGGGKLKNLVSVIEILLHKKIVFDKSTIDELTFIKMINNFDDYYSIILLTKNLLNMKNNNFSFLTAKNTILRQQISLFLHKNISYDAVNIVDLTEDEYCELSFIYVMLDSINIFERHNKNDISKLPDSYFPNFNDERIRYLLLKVMNHPDHLY